MIKPWEGGDRMKIEIRIDKNCDEPKVIVVTDKVTDEINEIVTRL